jgi:hypothetical protein
MSTSTAYVLPRASTAQASAEAQWAGERARLQASVAALSQQLQAATAAASAGSAAGDEAAAWRGRLTRLRGEVEAVRREREAALAALRSAGLEHLLLAPGTRAMASSAEGFGDAGGVSDAVLAGGARAFPPAAAAPPPGVRAGGLLFPAGGRQAPSWAVQPGGPPLGLGHAAGVGWPHAAGPGAAGGAVGGRLGPRPAWPGGPQQ